MRRTKRRPKRARGVPVQVYLSGHEQTLLVTLAAMKRVSVAELIRGWIVASAAARGIVSDDPRQLPPFA